MRRTPQSACTFRFHQVDVCPFRGYPPQATRATFVSSLLCPAHLACRPLAFPASGTQAPGRRFSSSAVLVAYASACMCARNVSVTPPSSLWVSPSLAPLKVVNCTRAAFKEVLSVAQSADPAATTTTILAPVGLNLSARDVIYLPSRHRLEMTSLQVQIRPVVLTVTDVFLYTVERVMAAGTACPQGASRCKATSGTSQTAESSVLALDMETELQQSVDSALTVSTAPLSVLLHTASVSEVRLEVSYDRSVDPPAGAHVGAPAVTVSRSHCSRQSHLQKCWWCQCVENHGTRCGVLPG